MSIYEQHLTLTDAQADRVWAALLTDPDVPVTALRTALTELAFAIELIQTGMSLVEITEVRARLNAAESLCSCYECQWATHSCTYTHETGRTDCGCELPNEPLDGGRHAWAVRTLGGAS